MESDVGNAIAKLTKGKDKKNDTLIIMTPFANWDKFLSPAPFAIALLGELLTISTKTDFDLREKMPEKGFEYIKYPDSFRACLVQVVNRGWRAFNEAHTCMDQIRLSTSNVDSHIRDAVRILLAGTPLEVEKVLPLALQSVEQIAEDCLEHAKRIESEFKFVLSLTDELLEASTNTKSLYERKTKDTIIKMEVAKTEHKRAEEEQKRRQKRYNNMMIQIDKAQDQFEKAVKDMPGSGKLLVLSLAEGCTDTIKSIISLPANIIRGVGLGSSKHKNEMVPGMAQNQTTKKPNYNAQEDEHNVLCIVYRIDNYISILIKFLGAPGSDPDTNGIKESTAIIKESLQFEKNTIGKAKDSGKVGQIAFNICEEGIKLCEEAQRLVQSFSEVSEDKILGLQERVSKLRDENMTLVARANKLTGRCPLDEQSPCFFDKRAINQMRGIVDITYETGRYKVELAKENLRDARNKVEAEVNQIEKSTELMYEALKAMQRLRIEMVDFEAVRKTLQEGILALGQVKAQWGLLVFFFQEISNNIKCCMNTSLKRFVQTAHTRGELQFENKVLSNAFRTNMYDQTLQASRVSYVINSIAGTYVDISREHLMGQISRLALLIGLDPETQKEKIINERARLHAECEAAQRSINQKIKTQHQEYEIAVKNRIREIERDLEAILPVQENLPAIKEAIRIGFSDEDFDDLVG